MLKIRLARVGKSSTPIFRLVVAEKSRAVKRENLEILGVFTPTSKNNRFQVKKERVLYWISKGAQPSLTANNLLCDFDVLPKSKKIKITFGKSQKKKEVRAEKEKQPTAAGQPEAAAEEMVEEESAKGRETAVEEEPKKESALEAKSRSIEPEKFSGKDHLAEEAPVNKSDKNN